MARFSAPRQFPDDPAGLLPRKPGKTPLWRNPRVRGYLYQAAILVLLLGAALVIYLNTLANLNRRGISSGFRFLSNEAGFAIGEITALPVLNAALLQFLAAVLCGFVGVSLLAKYLQSKGRKLGADHGGIIAAAVLLIGLPGTVLYFSGDLLQWRAYEHSSTYLMALLTGFTNTLKIAVLGCIFSTLLGLGVALARLSPNWLLKKLAAYYIEINRNIPVLLHLLFWYFIVFQQLPGVLQSLTLFDTIFLTNRGVFIPRPLAQQSFVWVVLALIAAVVAVCLLVVHVRRTRELTGRHLPILWPVASILVGFPALAILIAGPPLAWEVPYLQGFNYRGGIVLTPEFLALLTGLTVYVSAFNAEIIRSGIQSVNKGQIEAGRALGLMDGRIMRLVTLPQALRVIIPPLTNEYLAVAKNSSLAVAIGYPDLVNVGGTILNQTGQSIEVISIWMLVYLTISLTISMGMNWYNAKIMLVER